MLDLDTQKSVTRRAALTRRREAISASASALGCANLAAHLNALTGATVVAGYMAIQTEIDPRSAMTALYEAGKRICVPVIQGRARPLLFREWTPETPMIEGDFGALIPRGGELLTPDAAIVPLLAFDRRGYRLGYGGGFYDRTLALLRDHGGVHAVGFAFEAQGQEALPIDEFDQRLDAIVTEAGSLNFS